MQKVTVLIAMWNCHQVFFNGMSPTTGRQLRKYKSNLQHFLIVPVVLFDLQSLKYMSGRLFKRTSGILPMNVLTYCGEEGWFGDTGLFATGNYLGTKARWE
jgi:hypothetical protein